MYIIQNTCSGCHTCFLQCPAEAIHYSDMQYVIDQDQCIGCGGCYAVCPTCSVVDTQAPAPVPHDPVKKTCDVLVCGGGTGLIAAVRAAMEGKKVILVEKQRKVGGNTNLTHGFMAPYTDMHRERGLPDMREKMVEDTFRRADGWIRKDLIRAALYGVGDFFDWLCQFPGTKEAFVFKEGAGGIGPMAGSGISYEKRHFESLDNPDPSIGPGWMGTFVIHTMLNAIRDHGLDVEILTETAAKHLLTDESGAVVGAVCEGSGGTVTIHAGAVILATGGMGRSDEKLQEYFGVGDLNHTIMRFSVAGDTGDAIDMLKELGVQPDRSRMFLSLFGPAHHPWAYTLYRVMAHPSCLVLTLDGKRFFDEMGNHFVSRKYAAGIPDGRAWGITTDSLIDYMVDYYHKNPQFGDAPEVYDNTRKELEEELAMDCGSVFRADSLEELAEKIGMPQLPEAVAQYNAMCAAGKDAEFDKAPEHLKPLEKGPYYAVKGVCFSEGAFGGLHVNKDCEVMTQDSVVIPGLYGVGDATSAMHQQTVLAPISELTWAVASAFISGGKAVEYLNGK